MTSQRVVNYFAIVGVGKGYAGRPADLDEHEPSDDIIGTVLQCAALGNDATLPAPTGLELFCQPQGWTVSSTAHPPSFIPFVLTAENGTRTFCCCLLCYQPQLKEEEQQKREPSRSSVYFLDEGMEVSLDRRVLDGQVYQPICLCLVSTQPMFSVLQKCLCSIFVSWMVGDGRLEDAIASLSRLHYPLPGSEPVAVLQPPLTNLSLPPFHSALSLPYSDTAVLSLLKAVGVQNLISLFTAIVCDVSILFLSANYTDLVLAQQALIALVYPLELGYSLVPVVPRRLLDFLQLPSTFIMGVHDSCTEDLPAMEDVIVVDLDGGTLTVPESVTLYSFSQEILHPLRVALKRALDPAYPTHDCAFHSNGNPPKPQKLLDKEVRAVFLNLIALLVGDFQEYATVLRYLPQPAFYVDRKKFVLKQGATKEEIIYRKIAGSLAFTNFVLERCQPYRVCDFFDALLAKLISRGRLKPSYLFSVESIEALARELLELMPSCEVHEGTMETEELYGVPREQLMANYGKKTFPVLDETLLSELAAKYAAERNGPAEEQVANLLQPSKVPYLFRQSRVVVRQSSFCIKELEAVGQCLDALFKNEVMKARKYIPCVSQYLKQSHIREALVPELVSRLFKFKACMGHEQYDILARIFNTALLHEDIAARLVPLLTVFYRELTPTVKQTLYSSVQNHHMWEDAEFWKNALYQATQAELYRIYSDQEECSDSDEEGSSLHASSDDGQAVGLDGTSTLAKRIRYSHGQPVSPSWKNSLGHSLPRSVRSRMLRRQSKIPQESEGIQAPDAQPITSKACLELMADKAAVFPNLTKDEREYYIQLEENAVFNQVVLCLDRIILLRCPLDAPPKGREEEVLVTELSDWLVRFVRAVEVDMQLRNKIANTIADMVHESITLHLEYLRQLRKELDILPQTNLMKLIKPPQFLGEIQHQTLHCFLLPDGRESGDSLPAEGYIFVTSYRVMFIGTPCDPSVRNSVVIRTMPLASLYQIKELTAGPFSYPAQGLTVAGGIQMRALSGQLMRIGFDSEGTVLNIRKVTRTVVEARYPAKITCGLRTDSDASTRRGSEDRPQDLVASVSQPRLTTSQSRSRRRDTADVPETAAILSRLSQSACCTEYSRLHLGSLNMAGTGTGDWRVSKVNLEYTVCESYPCTIVIPEKLSDQTVINVAAEFTDNRFPVATWRNNRTGATLLRSGSFHAVWKRLAKHHLSAAHATHASKLPLPPEQQEKRQLEMRNAEVEIVMKSIVEVTPSYYKKITSHSVSSLSDGVVPMGSALQRYWEEENLACSQEEMTLRRTVSGKNKNEDDDSNSEEGSSDEMTGKDDNDGSEEISEGGRNRHGKSNELMDQLHHSASHRLPVVAGLAAAAGQSGESPDNFSSIPTAPSDWVTVDLLPTIVRTWRPSPLYIIGDKDKLKGVPKDLFADCVIVPVEVPDVHSVMSSFKKLMRACNPSSSKPGPSTFLSDVEESGWLTSLTTLLQLASAVADLNSIQSSSVLIALEKGMDATAQVVSLVQLLLDPHYRTLEGFRVMVEKDWLAFGHPFTKRSNQTHGAALKHDLSPVFLQFLDAVHQILRQFPHSFEFNDFYLRTMAYHYTSMRFSTFCFNSEKERGEHVWADGGPVAAPQRGRPYSPPTSPVKKSPSLSFWSYIDDLDEQTTLFLNPLYSNKNYTEVLKPHAYQANLDIWTFYTENNLSRFPPYDCELMSHVDLTLEDITRGYFSQSVLQGLRPLSAQEVASNHLELELIKYERLKQQTLIGHTPSAGVLPKGWKASWYQLQDHCSSLLSQLAAQNRPQLMAGPAKLVSCHTDSLHRQTSLAVLTKTHLSMELVSKLKKPHCFVPDIPKHTVVCAFCKHKIGYKQAHKCTHCASHCHSYCKSLMPHNCGAKKTPALGPAVFRSTSGEPPKNIASVEEAFRFRQGSSTFYVQNSANLGGQIFEGLLYKKGAIVKNWKFRWFLLSPTQGELSYFYTRDDERCLGTILLKDVLDVKEAGAYHVSVLAPGEVGYIFDVVTPKRTYHLMAQDEVSRKSWMSRLRAAAEMQ